MARVDPLWGMTEVWGEPGAYSKGWQLGNIFFCRGLIWATVWVLGGIGDVRQFYFVGV
jgi:hypothetical protein